MNILLICVGKLKEVYWKDACAEYAKRLSLFCKFSILELPESRLPDNPSKAQIESALKVEGEKILTAVGSSHMIALCVEGRLLSSEKFADYIQNLGIKGHSTVSLVIGSSFGLSDEVKKAAALQLSMSSMTFPHQLARVMLCEQVYRSFQIINHGKYHK